MEKTEKKIIPSWILHTASTDAEYPLYLFHDERKYGIKFENQEEFVNNPVKSDYFESFRKATAYMEETGSIIEKFNIIGIPELDIPASQIGKKIKIDFIFPGALNLNMPFVIDEVFPKELKAEIGLKIRCIMELVDSGAFQKIDSDGRQKVNA